MSDFNPVLFKKFLSSIILSEINVEDKSHTVRLIGQDIRNMLDRDIRGIDFNKSVSPHLIDESLQRQKSFHEVPRGSYSAFPVNFENGLSMTVQVTQLPLWGNDNQRMLLSHTRALKASRSIATSKVATFNEYREFDEFIEI